MNATRVLTLTLVVTTAIFLPPAAAQITRSGGGYLFRMKHSAGSTYRYSMQIETAGRKIPNGRVVQDSPFRFDVKSVAGGKARVEMVFESSEGKKDEEFSFPITIDARGRTTNAVTGKPFQRLGVEFPARPVAVGKPFKVSANPTTLTGKVPVRDTYTLKGLRTVDGRKVAEFAVTSKASSKDLKVAGSGIMLIDVADGYLYRYVYTQKVTAKVDGETATITQKVTLRRR